MTSGILLWIAGSIYSLWRIIVVSSYEGKVTNADRLVVAFALSPLSPIVAVLLFLAEGICFISEAHQKWYNSPKQVARRLERKIRKRRRGPLVWAVETLHQKRQEKKNDETLPKA